MGLRTTCSHHHGNRFPSLPHALVITMVTDFLPSFMGQLGGGTLLVSCRGHTDVQLSALIAYQDINDML